VRALCSCFELALEAWDPALHQVHVVQEYPATLSHVSAGVWMPVTLVMAMHDLMQGDQDASYQDTQSVCAHVWSGVR
jgi:hypothetical protein